jgi:hypothetical protein
MNLLFHSEIWGSWELNKAMIGKPRINYVGQWSFGPNDANYQPADLTRFGLLLNSELFLNGMSRRAGIKQNGIFFLPF